MRNFGRVLRVALRYRFSIIASFVCSVMVGVLWGANIAALYPFVEVVFRGESFHDWADAWVAEQEEACAGLTQSIEDLRGKLAQAPPEQKADLQTRIAQEKAGLGSAQAKLAKAQTCRRLIRRYLPADPFQGLVWVVAALLLGTILKSAFLVANVILVARVRQHAVFDLQNEFFARTLRLDLATFGEHRTSGLLSRFTHDMRVLETGLGTLLGQAVREPLKMVACLVGAAMISWQLLLLSLAITPLGLLLMRQLTQAMRRTSGWSMDIISELYGRLSEAFNGITVVKAFGTEKHEHRRFVDVGREYVHRSMRFTKYFAMLKPVTEILGLIVVAMAILIGAYLVLNQKVHVFGIRLSDKPLSAGMLMVFFGMLAGVADPARKMSDIYAMLIGGIAAADRVYAVMDRSPTVTDPAQPIAVPSPHHELSLERVSFHYRDSEPVLHDLDLRIRFGETVGLVGPNGCGKSTLVNLIPRFFDPVEGSVRLDGVDLREMSLEDLRRRIGLVTQETLLFDETIINNIRYGSPQATDEQVMEAAGRAHAHQFITEILEEGYQTIVGQGGSRLSGGQRQRIAVARAILRDPEILIFDEATSQIDSESEQLIRQALEEFIQGRTTIIISHRFSTLALASRIIVMEAGRIVGCGTHEELMQGCPLYDRFYHSQMLEAA